MILVVLDENGDSIGQVSLNEMRFVLENNQMLNQSTIVVKTTNPGRPTSMVFGDDDGTILDIHSVELECTFSYMAKDTFLTFQPGKFHFTVNTVSKDKDTVLPLSKTFLPRWLRIK